MCPAQRSLLPRKKQTNKQKQNQKRYKDVDIKYENSYNVMFSTVFSLST